MLTTLWRKTAIVVACAATVLVAAKLEAVRGAAVNSSSVPFGAGRAQAVLSAGNDGLDDSSRPVAVKMALLATAKDSDQPPELGVGPAHWHGPGGFGTWGNVPSRPATLSPFSALEISAVDNLANPLNNEIMPTTNTHVIFWLPAGFHYSSGTTAATDTQYENTILQYFKDVGGSQILNTTTQYPGKNGTPADTSTFIDSIVDTNAFPHTGADVANAVTQTDINTEVFNQIGAHAWPLGLSDMYFVFLPNHLVDCNDALTKCNTNKYCAYHTYGFSGSDTPANDFVWADIPDNRSIYSVIAGCGDSNVTGDESADTTLSSTEHEHMEAITDPRLNAWQDSTGAENGDKCNREMGVADASSTTANNYLGSGNTDEFRIQREWSNAVSGCAASYTTTGSHVESPAPSGSDVTLSVTEATIPGNNGNLLHYTLTFKNPSNQDDAFTIQAVATLPGGVTGTTTFSLGDLAPHQTATRSFTATVTGGPLLAGTVLTNSVKFDFNDSTGTPQPSITRTATTTVVNDPPALVLPGPQSQDYHDTLSFGITATDTESGDTVSLSASGLPANLTFTDNGDRTGTVSGTITAAPAVYVATFSANDHHHVSPVTGTVTITVTHEETTLTYTGVTGPVLDGSMVTLSGTLLEDGTTPIAGRTLTFTLGLGVTAQTCGGTTGVTGAASCTITVHQLPGPRQIVAFFAGDAFYLSSSATSSIVVFTAMSLKQDVLAEATALLAGATKPDANKLKDIVKNLTDSLDPSLWVDGNHVETKHGDQVFNNEKQAVQKLMDLLKNSSIPGATLQEMIDTLVHADRVLAEVALADAIAASGDPHKIAEAQQELAKAADELTKGHFDAAIDHYKSAWKDAEEATP
jgi:hypothetical protein